MRLSRSNRGRVRVCTILVPIGGLLLTTALASCGRNATGHLAGQMYVPSGLGGNAPWGSVWLVRDYTRLQRDLVEHERLLVLALMSEDAAFLRSQQEAIRRLSDIYARLQAIDEGRIPTGTRLAPPIEVTPTTTFAAIIRGVEVQARRVSPPRDSLAVARMKEALKDSAMAVRHRMQPAIRTLMADRSNQKQLLLKDADGIVMDYRMRVAPVGMDGAFNLDRLPPGNYGIYARYALLRWYVLSPVRVIGNSVARPEVPAPPSITVDSRAVVGLDVLVSQIEDM